MSTYIATATAIMTTVIAALVAVITWGQWRTNRARLRHELFDRRYAAYQRVAGFIVQVLQSGGVKLGSDDEFLRQTKEAYFIFACDRQIQGFLAEIHAHAVTLQTLQTKENGLSGAMLGVNVDKQSQEKEWFRAALASVEERFEEYLCLED